MKRTEFNKIIEMFRIAHPDLLLLRQPCTDEYFLEYAYIDDSGEIYGCKKITTYPEYERILDELKEYFKITLSNMSIDKYQYLSLERNFVFEAE